jgi:hypothetical protein
LSGPALHDDFRDLLVALQEAGVRFLIVGAHALAVHGIPRATGDLDLLVAPDAENASRLMLALGDFGAPVESHGITARDFEKEGTVYQLGLPPRRIDLMTSISGVSFEEAEGTAIETEIEGLCVPVLGRRQLVVNKLASGRPKDLADAQMLGEEPGDDRQSEE